MGRTRVCFTPEEDKIIIEAINTHGKYAMRELQRTLPERKYQSTLARVAWLKERGLAGVATEPQEKEPVGRTWRITLEDETRLSAAAPNAASALSMLNQALMAKVIAVTVVAA